MQVVQHLEVAGIRALLHVSADGLRHITPPSLLLAVGRLALVVRSTSDCKPPFIDETIR